MSLILNSPSIQNASSLPLLPLNGINTKLVKEIDQKISSLLKENSTLAAKENLKEIQECWKVIKDELSQNQKAQCPLALTAMQNTIDKALNGTVFPFKQKYYEELLTRACFANDLSLATSLIEKHSINVNNCGEETLVDLGTLKIKIYRSVLQNACASGHYEMVKLLVTSGANVNAYLKDQNIPPLYQAALSSSLDKIRIMQYLIDQGADANLRNWRGVPYLVCLIDKHIKTGCSEFTNTVQLLLDSGTMVSTENKEDRKENKDIGRWTGTLLAEACAKGDLSLIRLLVYNGIPVLAEDRRIALRKGTGEVLSQAITIREQAVTEVKNRLRKYLSADPSILTLPSDLLQLIAEYDETCFRKEVLQRCHELAVAPSCKK